MKVSTQVSRALVIAVAGVLAASAAQSQAVGSAGESAGPNADASGLESITVTARRREERAQDVPVTVLTVAEAEIQEQDIKTAWDLQKNFSGLTMCCSRGGGGGYTFMRGVKGVVGYWAEVPVNLGGSALFFDIGNVQVLKGPQGTLFGLSTNGGAILNEPVRPQNELGGYASAALGDFDRRTIEGVINVPVSDSLRVRFGALSHYTEGHILDISNGKRYGGEDHYIIRGSAIWEPTDWFSNYTVLNYYHTEISPSAGVGLGGDTVIEAIKPGGRADQLYGQELRDFMERQRAVGRYVVLGTSLPGGPWAEVDQYNFSNITTIDVSSTRAIRLITGVQSFLANQRTDTDMTPFPLGGTAEPTGTVEDPTYTYSFEPQLQGSAFDERLTYVIGSFNSWLREPEATVNYTYNLGTRSGTATRNRSRNNSIYAEGTYAITDTFSFMLGYRHSWDKRESQTQSYNAASQPAGPLRLREGEWNEGSYRWGVTWKPSDTTMLYFTNSKGYSSGGFNGGALPVYLQRYEPESLNSFEVGIKADWYPGNMQIRTNLAAFYGLYDDVQVLVPTLYVNPDTGTTQSGLPTGNAAEGEVKGIEGEFTFLPIPSLTLSGNFGYTRNEYTKYVGVDTSDPTGNTLVDMSNLPFLYAPKWKYAASITYELPLPSTIGVISVGADYTWQDELANEARPKGTNPYVFNAPIENLNASVTWKDVLGRTGMTATLFFTNLTEEDYNNSQFTGYETNGWFGRGAAVPRSWGLRFRYEF
jgi:iron complex outermembrane receptor protein